MRALMYRGPEYVTVGNKPDPRIEHPGDVILKVTHAAICGSDLHLYHGLVPDTRVGHTFGHEFAGEVVETGREVRRLRQGDRVVVPFNISCGGCFYCERGLTALCESSNPDNDLCSGVFGYSHTSGGFDGGHAEYVRVPYADVGPMLVPDDMDTEEVLFLGDILPTGYMGAEMADIAPGETVVVFGAGPVGLFTARCAWLLGAGRVIVVDHIPERLEKARSFAAAEVIDFDAVEDPILHIKEMTEGRGADRVVDAVGCDAGGSRFHTWTGKLLKLQAGSPSALNMAIHAVRKGGTVSIVGVYGPPMNMVAIGTAMNKNLTFRMGQCNVRRYMHRLLEHIRAGRIEPSAIISHRLTLEEAPRGYDLFFKKKDACIKVVLRPHVTA